MAETNMEDVANKLQSLEKSILVLRDCYITLHNDLIHRKVDPERALIEYLAQYKRDLNCLLFSMGQSVDKFNDKVKEISPEITGCFKWIASHIDEIEKRLTAIEAKEEKKVVITMSLDTPKEVVIEKEDPSIRERITLFELYKLLGKKMATILKFRFPEEGKVSSYASIGEVLRISGTSVSVFESKALRKCRQIHEETKELDLRKLPAGSLRFAIFGE